MLVAGKGFGQGKHHYYYRCLSQAGVRWLYGCVFLRPVPARVHRPGEFQPSGTGTFHRRWIWAIFWSLILRTGKGTPNGTLAISVGPTPHLFFSIFAARVTHEAGALRSQDLKGVKVDTTVQPNAITFRPNPSSRMRRVKGPTVWRGGLGSGCGNPIVARPGARR